MRFNALAILVISFSFGCAHPHPPRTTTATPQEVFSSARRGDSEEQVRNEFGPPSSVRPHVLTYSQGAIAVDLTFTMGGRLEDVALHQK